MPKESLVPNNPLEHHYFQFLEISMVLKNTYFSISTIIKKFEETNSGVDKNLMACLQAEADILAEEIQRMADILNTQKELLYKVK